MPSWRLVSGLALLGFAALAGLFVFIYASVGIPDANATAREQATVYYWADGTPMVSVGAVNRQDVALAQVPRSLQNAVVAAENADFYTDSGISVGGMVRAAVNIVKGEETQGGSTITQQYVKNTYLSQDQTVGRKVRELFLSLKLSNQEPKQEILQGYLNTSWFGRDAYGVQAASYAYYGVPAKELNAGQGAVLAGLLKGAEQFDPSLSTANHARAVDRWEWILDREVATGTMTAAERATYRTFPEPKKAVKPSSQAGQIGYLLDIANKYIKSRAGLTDQDLARGGYRVHTTFEKGKVRALSDAVEKVRRESLDPKKRATDRYVEVGAASVRPGDGAIVAVYGGANAVEHFSNNADTAGVPAGSAFKPFVYAAALESSRASDLARALITSENAPFVEAGKHLGLEKVKDVAVSAGLREESMAKLEPTFSIGTSTPSAVRLASAYTAFVRQGSRTEPYSVTRVLRDGDPLDGFARPEARQAMPAGVADQVGESLRLVGQLTFSPVIAPAVMPDRMPMAIGRADDAVRAGKTSDNDRMRSAWFIGSSKELSTAVTLFRTKPGTPQLLPLQGVGGAGSERGSVFPPRIWAAYHHTVAPQSFGTTS
ncbi:transglycosylase domain-containing protein [Streptomyces sp. NPDC088725]|uniref:transglycosylase domain-containing protein n=1 Tax=Streptomyces sp. NPDC088725 TaxID=3365873 RepID=UPI003814E960